MKNGRLLYALFLTSNSHPEYVKIFQVEKLEKLKKLSEEHSKSLQSLFSSFQSIFHLERWF